MKRSKRVVFALGFGIVMMLGGCASPAGLWYTDIITAYHPVIGKTGTKRGEACSSNILGLIATGDGGLEAARKKGGITNIANVDHHMTSILGLYSTFCTIVYGS